MSDEFIVSTNLQVGERVHGIFDGNDSVSHIIAKFDDRCHPGSNCYGTAVCYASIVVYWSQRSEKPLCTFCSEGEPNPDNISEHTAQQPEFWQQYPQIAIENLANCVNRYREMWLEAQERCKRDHSVGPKPTDE